jgi:hypothetical protein
MGLKKQGCHTDRGCGASTKPSDVPEGPRQRLMNWAHQPQRVWREKNSRWCCGGRRGRLPRRIAGWQAARGARLSTTEHAWPAVGAAAHRARTTCTRGMLGGQHTGPPAHRAASTQGQSGGQSCAGTVPQLAAAAAQGAHAGLDKCVCGVFGPTEEGPEGEGTQVKLPRRASVTACSY